MLCLCISLLVYAPHDSTQWYWWTWYVNSALGAQVLSTCSTQWAWWLPDLITISPAHFRKKNSQQQEPNSDTIPPSQNRCPFPPQLQSVSPCSYPDFTLSPHTEQRVEGPLPSVSPSSRLQQLFQVLLPVGMHLKELEASVLTCCNAEQLLLRLHINLRWSAHDGQHVLRVWQHLLYGQGQGQWRFRPLT